MFVVLAHDRRQILHVNVTGHPTAAWTAQQLRNAFPWDTAPRFLLRDRDGTYGEEFRACLDAMEIDEVLTAPRSPWQNPYVERLIGSMRRECVDHAAARGRPPPQLPSPRGLTTASDGCLRTESPLNLRLMRVIDEQFLETPFYNRSSGGRRSRRTCGVSRGISPAYIMTMPEANQMTKSTPSGMPK